MCQMLFLWWYCEWLMDGLYEFMMMLPEEEYLIFNRAFDDAM